MNESIVSVVTPFRNTAKYLTECIESVLAQNYPHFEYILSDNCSSDGSTEIAESYARLDPRIRFIRQPETLSQVQHYNSALLNISDSSRYCKIVQADDFIFPDCLKSMVRAFEQSESIGLVSSYDLKGSAVRGSGFPFGKSNLPGKEVARLFLRTGVYVFGSPTTVMYRSSVIRDCQPFFQEGLLHEDTEKCMQLLEHWDFGFVYQVLSFLRTGNESVSSVSRNLRPELLDYYIIVRRFGQAFLEAPEAAKRTSRIRRLYYRVLATEALRMRGRHFWQYHRDGLKTIGETLDYGTLIACLFEELLWMAVNPGLTSSRFGRFLWRRKNPQAGAQS